MKTLGMIILSLVLLVGVVEKQTLLSEKQAEYYETQYQERTQKELETIRKRDKEIYQKYIYNLKF